MFNDQKESVTAVFEGNDPFYEKVGGRPEGFKILDRIPGTPGCQSIVAPELPCQLIKGLVTTSGNPPQKPKIINIPHGNIATLLKMQRFAHLKDLPPNQIKPKLIEILNEELITTLTTNAMPQSFILANAHADPNNKQFGIAAYYVSGKEGECLGIHGGLIVEESPEVSRKGGEYSLDIEKEGTSVDGLKYRTLPSYFADLPPKEEVERYRCYPPELKDQFQTANVTHILVECEGLDYSVQLLFISANPVASTLVGYPYSNRYWNTYPARFDKKNREIPSALYCGDLVKIFAPAMGIKVEYPVDVDRKFVIYHIKYGKEEIIDVFGVKVFFVPSALRSRLEQLGYIPTKPKKLSHTKPADLFIEAAKTNDIKTLMYLLEWAEPLFTDINHVTEDGRTALHHAVAADNVYIVLYLLNNGIQISIRDISGKTALDMAIEQKNEEITAHLVNYMIRRTACMPLLIKPQTNKSMLKTSSCKHGIGNEFGVVRVAKSEGDDTTGDFNPPYIYTREVDFQKAKDDCKKKMIKLLQHLFEPPTAPWICDENFTTASLTMVDRETADKVLTHCKQKYPRLTLTHKTTENQTNIVITNLHDLFMHMDACSIAHHFNQLGKEATDQGELKRALDYFMTAQNKLSEILLTYPNIRTWNLDLAAANYNLASTCYKLNNKAVAHQAIDACLLIRRKYLAPDSELVKKAEAKKTSFDEKSADASSVKVLIASKKPPNGKSGALPITASTSAKMAGSSASSTPKPY